MARISRSSRTGSSELNVVRSAAFSGSVIRASASSRSKGETGGSYVLETLAVGRTNLMRGSGMLTDRRYDYFNWRLLTVRRRGDRAGKLREIGAASVCQGSPSNVATLLPRESARQCCLAVQLRRFLPAVSMMKTAQPWHWFTVASRDGFNSTFLRCGVSFSSES